MKMMDLWRSYLKRAHDETVREISNNLAKYKIKKVREINEKPYVFSKDEIRQSSKSDDWLLHSILKKKSLRIPKNVKSLIIFEHNINSKDFLIYLAERLFLRVPKQSWSSKRYVERYVGDEGFELMDYTKVAGSRNMIFVAERKTVSRIKEYFSKKSQDWLAKNPGNRLNYFWHDKRFIEFCNIRNGERTLDVGCGIATLAIGAHERGAESHALDVTPGMLGAGKRNAKKNSAKILFHLGNAESTGLKKGYFDKIISSGVPEHTPDPEMFISEMSRILKSQGEIDIQVLGNKNPLLLIFKRIKGNFRVQNLRGKRFFVDIMDQYGFEVIDIKGSMFINLPYSNLPPRPAYVLARIHTIIEDYVLKPIFNGIGLNGWAFSFYIKAKKKEK